eukprot:SAG11_NODE_2108_length_3810_cov_1.772029_1_plen_162_part_00
MAELAAVLVALQGLEARMIAQDARFQALELKVEGGVAEAARKEEGEGALDRSGEGLGAGAEGGGACAPTEEGAAAVAPHAAAADVAVEVDLRAVTSDGLRAIVEARAAAPTQADNRAVAGEGPRAAVNEEGAGLLWAERCVRPRPGGRGHLRAHYFLLTLI